MPTIVWEELESKKDNKKTSSTVERAKIPNGWLVRMYNTDHHADEYSGFGWGFGGLAFIPDPDHKWDGNSL